MSDAGIEARMASYLKRIATGPEMSKDLTREEARDGMELVLRGAVDSVQAGVFLVALRMKRESDDENRSVLDALRAFSAAMLGFALPLTAVTLIALLARHRTRGGARHDPRRLRRAAHRACRAGARRAVRRSVVGAGRNPPKLSLNEPHQQCF